MSEDLEGGFIWYSEYLNLKEEYDKLIESQKKEKYFITDTWTWDEKEYELTKDQYEIINEILIEFPSATEGLIIEKQEDEEFNF